MISAMTSILQKNKRLVTAALKHRVMTHCGRLQIESILKKSDNDKSQRWSWFCYPHLWLGLVRDLLDNVSDTL